MPTSLIFHAFDRGVISRRHLLQALGIAVAIKPATALAQGQCGGANKGTPGCETTPAKLPESTGWKTVLLDHFPARPSTTPRKRVLPVAHELEDSQRRWEAATLDIGDWGDSTRGDTSRRLLHPRRHRCRLRVPVPRAAGRRARDEAAVSRVRA